MPFESNVQCWGFRHHVRTNTQPEPGAGHCRATKPPATQIFPAVPPSPISFTPTRLRYKILCPLCENFWFTDILLRRASLSPFLYTGMSMLYNSESLSISSRPPTSRPWTGQSASRPYTGQSRPTTGRPQTSASSRYEGSQVVLAILEGRGVGREVGIAALDKDTGRVNLIQVICFFLTGALESNANRKEHLASGLSDIRQNPTPNAYT